MSVEETRLFVGRDQTSIAELLAAVYGIERIVDIQHDGFGHLLEGGAVEIDQHPPEFAAKAAEVVGLYMAPPENAIVISVDEKPSIQALERRQGYPKLPSGRALTGQSHDYKRHGTTTLFAALNVATGKVRGRQYKRCRRIEFLDLMNRIVAEHPGREIHVILDNLPVRPSRSSLKHENSPGRSRWSRVQNRLVS